MYRFSNLVVAAFATILLLTASVQAQPKDYRWEDEAKKHELSDQEIKSLRQNKFVISGEPFKQVFVPYLASDVPVFITTDSVLAAFHVLLEESILRFELANAHRLPAILDRILNNISPTAAQLKRDPPLLTAALKRVTIFLGTARHLLDDKSLPASLGFKTLVEEESQRVTAAKSTSKPAWLGPPDDGFLALDYSRFKPRGFYTKSPALERDSRAVSWLQAIPFRLESDEELAAFFLMHHAGNAGEKESRQTKDFWSAFHSFLGSADDWDLASRHRAPTELTKAGLEEARRSYSRGGTGPQINDQIAVTRTDSKVEVAFRFLSAHRVPDALMFQRTMSPAVGRRDVPTGLEVAAALGSPFAPKELSRDNPKVLQEIDLLKSRFEESSLYGKYLQCLRVLFTRAEPDAPALFHSEAWQIKTCQTALAGWAQMRHAFALQVKQGANYVSSYEAEKGFVEPVPEFYAHLAKLTKSANDTLAKVGAFDVKVSEQELVADLQAAKAIVAKARKERKDFDSLSVSERSLLIQFDPQLNSWEKWEKNGRDTFATIEQILTFCPDLDKGVISEGFTELFGLQVDFTNHWTYLIDVCERLERCAYKQLRKVPFGEADVAFLRDYGRYLAGIMLYGGNSYSSPRDDAPRIVDVFTNPNVGKHLLVGTAKPRMIWVLYPTKGTEILCRGAIVPYHEFPNAQRLTNTEWKALLDSSSAPAAPTWTFSFTVTERSSQSKK